MKQTRSHKQFGGYSQFFTHDSKTCNGPMNFAAYLPPAAREKKLPAVYFLSGLTCNEEIFMTEGQAQSYAAELGLIVVVPDSSPRKTGIEGEDATYDLGSGASFYVDAETPKWSKHYQMESYITQELRELVEANLPIDPSKRGIFGHSMGGHGALTLGLRHPELYQSISAFAPIGNPAKTPWGIKAFSEYLGSDQTKWADHDASELMKKAKCRAPILIDQGLEDEFFAEELSTAVLEKAIQASRYPAELRRHAEYDHSYFFVSSFMKDHLKFHAKNLVR